MSHSSELQSIREDLEGNVCRNTDGFLAKYFESKPWFAQMEENLQNLSALQHIKQLIAGLQCPDETNDMTAWLANLQSFIRDKVQIEGNLDAEEICQGGLPLALSLNQGVVASQSDQRTLWAAGEIHDSRTMCKADEEEALMQFYKRAGQKFCSQPERLFLHAFLLCGHQLELFVFDRAGVYSSGQLDLLHRPLLLIQVIAGYFRMSREEAGFNKFISLSPTGAVQSVKLNCLDDLYLRPQPLHSPDCIVGPATTCYAASEKMADSPSKVVKFSWIEPDDQLTEIRLLDRAQKRGVVGVVQLLGHQELLSIFELRSGLHFATPVTQQTLSCIVTTPLGRPLRQFASLQELLMVFGDLVQALKSLYVDGKILHRDIAIKNAIIVHQCNDDRARGVLIDLDLALDLSDAYSPQPLIGSDGFMAIGILLGEVHTYRHDLESLFYVFLWLAIGDDREHDDALDILKKLPKASRLRKWCTMDFRTVGQDKRDDMSREGFEAVISEFSSTFAPLQGLAWSLHAILFPIRDGVMFVGTDSSPVAVESMYDDMSQVFYDCAQSII